MLVTALLATLAAPLVAAPNLPGSMFIESCSLGCVGSGPGSQVLCSTVNISLSTQIDVYFSEDVDPTSVDVQTFTIVNVTNGTVPQGTLLTYPNDPLRVSFRPSVTFDPFGIPTYGLEANTAYQIFIGGVAQGDPGPFITSTQGNANQTRMQCTVLVGSGPGSPIQTECVTSPNSAGAGGLLSWTGSSSYAGNDLTLEASQLPSGQFGVFVMGTEPANVPLGNGTRCISGTLHRLGVTLSSSTGHASLPFDIPGNPAGSAVSIGSTWYFQHIYRDAAAGAALFNSTNGLRVTFVP